MNKKTNKKSIKERFAEANIDTYEKRPINFKKIGIILTILIILSAGGVLIWLYPMGGLRWKNIKNVSYNFAEKFVENKMNNWDELEKYSAFDEKRKTTNDFIWIYAATENSKDKKIEQHVVKKTNISNFTTLMKTKSINDHGSFYAHGSPAINQLRWDSSTNNPKPEYVDYSVGLTFNASADNELNKYVQGQKESTPFKDYLFNLNITDPEKGALGTAFSVFLDFNAKNKISLIRIINIEKYIPGIDMP